MTTNHKYQIPKDINSINKELSTLFNEYQKKQQPIEVNFRGYFPELNNSDRATHLIHSYPAKLLVHIPYFFLNNNILSKEGQSVLDPFCGSGTVLLESLFANRNAYGVDSNPLARLISRVKTNQYNIERLHAYLDLLKGYRGSVKKKLYPSVVNIDYWFLPNVQKQLSEILEMINTIEDNVYRDFFMVCYSNCVRKVSLADPRVSVPVKIRDHHYPLGHPFRNKNNQIKKLLETIDVKQKFFDISIENIRRTTSFEALSKNRISTIVSDDAKHIIKPLKNGFSGLDPNCIDLVITSPPYCGAQKYIRSSSLSLGWTELASVEELKELDKLSIGRENYKKAEYHELIETGVKEADTVLFNIYSYNPLRAHIAANYLIEMKTALNEIWKVLKNDGYLIIVAANNQVCNKEFKTQEYLQKIIENLGAKTILRLIDDIKSYGLMTKRNKTANIITREWILVFQKPS